MGQWLRLGYRLPVDWAGIRPLGERRHVATTLVSLAARPPHDVSFVRQGTRADSHTGTAFFMLHHARKTIPPLLSPSIVVGGGGGGKLHMHASTRRVSFVN